MPSPFIPKPAHGFGLGLRPHYHSDILDKKIPVDFFEIISENYMYTRGRPRWVLEKLRAHTPFVFHGVSLNIGSSDPINGDYLKTLQTLITGFEPALVSDHICWGGTGGENLHDLLPIPYNQRNLEHLIPRVQHVQDTLGRQLVLENVSSYVTYRASDMTEWEFIAELSQRTGCGLLLDLNNVFVNSFNHGFDPITFVRGIPTNAVKQFHLAGHTDMGDYLFDTHNNLVVPTVWKLYELACELFPHAITLVEWDADFPEFSVLLEELGRARDIAARVTQKRTLPSFGFSGATP